MIKSRVKDLGWLGLVIGGLGFFFASHSQQRFDFFDMSGFFDAAYRVARGQRPYLDFFYIAGPVHLWAFAVFVKVLGVGKAAVQWHLAFATGAAAAMAYVMARRRFSGPISAVFAAWAGVAFYGPIAFPWYDQTAFLFVVAAVLCIQRCGSRGASWAGAFIALSFFAKSNIGVGAFAVVGVWLALERQSDHVRGVVRALAFYLAGVLAASALVLLATGQPFRFYEQVFALYPASKRFSEFDKLGRALTQTPYVWVIACVVLAAFFAGIESVKARLADFFLPIGMAVLSLWAAWTGSFMIPSNLVLLGFEALWVAILWRGTFLLPMPKPRRQKLRVAAIVVSLVAVLWGARTLSETDSLSTWGWKPSNFIVDYAFETEALKGWRCNRAIGQGFDQAVAAMRTMVPASDSLFVFPDATIVYGLLGHEPYRRAPFMFHKGFIPLGAPAEEFKTQFFAYPPKWILIHDAHEVPDMSAGPILEWLGLTQEVIGSYAEMGRWGEFALLRRK